MQNKNNESFKNSFEEIYNESYQDFIHRYFVKSVDSTGRLLSIGDFMDIFFDNLHSVLKVASLVSLNLKLTTIRDVRTRIGICLSVANKIIEGEKIGLYKQEEYSPPEPQDNVETIDNTSNYLAYRFEFSKSPLLVAKANIDGYKAIIKTMDIEEEMVLIELKNGKGLDFSNLNTIKIDGSSDINIEKDNSKFQNSLSQFINEINSLELVNTDVSYSYYAEKNLLSPPAIRPYPENYADDTITILAINEDMKFYPSAIKELTTKVHTELILMDSVKRNEILGHLEKRLNELEAVIPLIWQLHDDLFIREEYTFLSKTMPMCKLDIILFSEFLEKYYNLKIPYNIGTKSSKKLSVIETQYGLAYITGQLFYDMLKRNRSQCDELKQLIEKLNQLTRNQTTFATEEKGVSLSHREIATLYYLNGIELTYENANDIAFYHGQTSRTSGRKLIDDYYSKIIKEVESLSNNKYNSEIYTYQNSFETLTKIIPLLKTDESKTLANEYLKKSISYRKVKQ